MPLERTHGISLETPIGGRAIRVINDTGEVSIRGRVLKASEAVDAAVMLCPADDDEALAIMYTEGVEDGGFVFVVTSGIAEVLLEDDTGTTRGNWLRTSITEAGTADGTNADPPGSGIGEVQQHFKEIGHVTQNVAGGGIGTNVLAKCWLHFN